MNVRAEEGLIECINALPSERRAQVVDFVNFLVVQEQRRQAIERLERLRGKLPVDEITEPEMQAIVDSVREVRAQMRAER